jgi:hypothetical protein
MFPRGELFCVTCNGRPFDRPVSLLYDNCKPLSTMPQNPDFDTIDDLTAGEILSLVRAHLPAWTQACEAADTDGIALHEAEFGTSTTELLLFACAIKFATKKGKNVYVICDEGRASSQEAVRSDRFIAVYREQSWSAPAHLARSKPKRPASRRSQP